MSPEPGVVDALLVRLDAETAPLRALLGTLDAEGFARPTPSPGWCVADQVSHLAYFDDAAAASLTGAFGPYLEEAGRLGAAFCDVVAARYRGDEPAALLAWLDGARTTLGVAARDAEPGSRWPWFGPPLSVAGMLAGRIMETWAHGQDVYDACGSAHPATAALAEVARLCARTRANSYATRGLAVPEVPVLVELAAPDGATWRFGDDGGETVRGDAVEFCLVATQRRHVEDTSLVVDGPAAREWLSIAQAFAGPPGTGRAPASVPG